MAGDSAGPEEAVAACGFDPSKPNAARVYDYLLGGKDNFAADREAAARLVEALPDAARVAKANRAFLAAAVRFEAGQGIAQYVDIGAGRRPSLRGRPGGPGDPPLRPGVRDE